MEIIFKNWEDCFYMDKLHSKLRPIVSYLVNLAHTRHGIRLEITSTFRADGGVHSLMRGIDLVPENRDVEVMETLRGEINREWDYGKAGLQVVPPVRHGTAPHIHLQARNETVRRVEV